MDATFRAPPLAIRRVDGWAIGLAVTVLGLGFLAAAAGSLMVREPAAAPEGTVAVPIAGRPVELPAAWLRERDGAAVELRIPLDAFAGAAGPAGATVLVRIAPAEASAAPADRAPLLHARFLAPAASPVEGGLIRREFRAGSPFEGEILYLAPPDGRAFAARCTERLAGGPRETCLAELRTGGAEMRLRLAPEHLAHWQAVTRGLARLAGG
jgi:hypothetical protein